jgi:hypothetical protein
MILFYRRHKDTLDPEWHFHTDCPHWPDTNFVQMHFINPEMNERFCEDCANLEATAQQPFSCHPTGRRVEMSIECHQVSRQAAFEGLSLPYQFSSPFRGVAGQ